MPVQKSNCTYFFVTRLEYRQSMGHISDSSSDFLIHHDYVPHRYAYTNTDKMDTVHNAINLTWQSIQNAITTEKK